MKRMNAHYLLLAATLTTSGVAQTVAPAPSVMVEPSHLDSTAELAQLMNATETVVPLQKYDLLNIHVFGADALTVRGRIAPDGGIDIPLAGHISLIGLTVEQAQHAIAALVQNQNLVLTPAVTIDVLETPGRVVIVTGEVKNPGVYPAYGDSQLTSSGATPSSGVHTLNQVLAIAGGLKDTASGIVTLVRPTLAGPVSIPLGTDPNKQTYASLPVFSGDEIRVASVGQAYVIGAVKKQGMIPLKSYSPTTVTQAVSMSDGIGFEGARNSAKLVRTQGNQRVMIAVHLSRILAGKEPDIALQNDDILYVPTNQGKAAVKGGATGLIVSLASTYIYAHP